MMRYLMTIPNGDYRTEAGSTVCVSGKHSGIFDVSFDWVEEKNACCDCHDCHADAEPFDCDGEFYLTWHCEECDGGQAKLFAIAPS